MHNLKCRQPALSDPVAVFEVSRLAKIQLIRKFQRSEGNFDCCASTAAYVRVCNQLDCLWRSECMVMVSANES